MPLVLEEYKTIPVCVKLSRVPVQYSTKLGLSYIASVIGKPLYMDVNTTKGHSLTFARICIEMAATSSFPDSIVLKLENGCTTNIVVEYPWKLAACTLCKVFDHSNKTCPKAVRREWMPRTILMAQRNPDDVDGWITVKKKAKDHEQVLKRPNQLVSPQTEEPVRVVTKQAPKTPIKCSEAKVAHAVSLEPIEAKGSPLELTETTCGEKERRDRTRMLLVGSSNGHRKRKKKGQGGLGARHFRSSK
ncbi:DUF4283 domain-containing protein [Cephalotus follicularis]|uniref:DUF4283 domain-containing protein n=1 Tax=Cephalotus follicularis TaxID=3775 RepID=A0A1Q3CU28_CEPFO|nr:DUF4283 domain-containing protein [Cephalotus follicularis]